MKRFKVVALDQLLLAVSSLGATRNDVKRRLLSSRVYNILLIVVDTFRADHLHCCQRRKTSPTMDALALTGGRFSNTVTALAGDQPGHGVDADRKVC